MCSKKEVKKVSIIDDFMSKVINLDEKGKDKKEKIDDYLLR